MSPLRGGNLRNTELLDGAVTTNGLAAAFLVGLAFLGCTAAQEGVRDMQSPDSGQPRLPDVSREPLLDAGSEFDAGQSKLGAGVDDCTGDESAPLLMIPEFLTVFQHSNSPCRPLGSGVLFRNNGITSLRVDGVETSSPEFTVVGDSFPIELEPGASLPLRVYFRGTQDGSVETRLTFSTGDGCRGFPIRGLRTAEALVTRTEEAFDFGRLGVRMLSEPHQFSVLTEMVPGSTIVHHAFGVDPPDVFEIVAATSPEVEVDACDTRDVAVRFHAPLSTGVFEGSLLWTSGISTAAGDAEGTMLIPLYATVTESPP